MEVDALDKVNNGINKNTDIAMVNLREHGNGTYTQINDRDVDHVGNEDTISRN